MGDGAARSWDQLLSLVNDALGSVGRGVAPAEPHQQRPSWEGDEVDRLLGAAGIGPDHPSLYDERWSDDQLERG